MGPEPRMYQIADELRQQIGNGTLGPGALMPSEPELAQSHGVSRQTARAALQILEQEGLVTVRPRRGRVVRRPPVLLPLSRYSRVLQPGGALGPWETACTEQGITPRVEVVAVERQEATAAVAARLEITAGEPVVYRRRHMYAGEDLAQVQEVWMPAELVAGSPLEGTGKVVGGVLAAWAALGRTPASLSESVSARPPTSEEVASMHLAPATPVLVVERITRDDTGTVLELLRLVAASDQTRLVYEDLPLGAA